MRRDDEVRFRHMLDVAEEAAGFAAGKHREDLDADRMLALALVRSIEIVGEAGARVSDDGRKAVPDVPWREIIHAYFDVDLDIVWQTVKEDMPTLIATLKVVLSEQK